jgi:L-2-hydroxyglutarate oxidase
MCTRNALARPTKPMTTDTSSTHAFGLGERYAMLPFKGLYWKLAPDALLTINGPIYPVPDLNVPFLGVHFTKRVDGEVHLGPTAIPAFGRENYAGLTGLAPAEIVPILSRLLGQYWGNKQGFRAYAHAESLRFFKTRFVEAAQALVPGLEGRHLIKSDKVGIRAQLLDKEKGELVMDFLVQQAPGSTHVLNAVSPAFTSAFAFARLVLDGAEVAVK